MIDGTSRSSGAPLGAQAHRGLLMRHTGFCAAPPGLRRAPERALAERFSRGPRQRQHVELVGMGTARSRHHGWRGR